MSRSLTLAAVQMNASPAPTPERLARAEALANQAACGGAQMIVLPEVFNTGYEYRNENFARAEPVSGLTITWMKNTAARLGVHLAGSLLLKDGGDIFNAMLIVSPDGRLWRYDKNYPWIFERVYFRQGRGVTVADTDLGRLGMMICWDVVHPRLWAKYAGRVDVMIVCSCPPAAYQPILSFPDGTIMHSQDAGAFFALAMRGSEHTFGPFLQRQAAWLGVPVVNTTGTGKFSTHIPAARISMSAFVLNSPKFWRYLRQLDLARMESGYFQETYVAGADGQVLARVPAEVEGFTLATVPLEDKPPQPTYPQPSFDLSPLAYVSDYFANFAYAMIYRRKVRRAFSTNHE